MAAKRNGHAPLPAYFGTLRMVSSRTTTIAHAWACAVLAVTIRLAKGGTATLRQDGKAPSGG
jgi:hypothetical protein